MRCVRTKPHTARRNVERSAAGSHPSAADAKALRATFADTLEYRLNLDKLDVNVSADRRQAVVTASISEIVTTRSRRRSSTTVGDFPSKNGGPAG